MPTTYRATLCLVLSLSALVLAPADADANHRHCPPAWYVPGAPLVVGAAATPVVSAIHLERGRFEFVTSCGRVRTRKSRHGRRLRAMLSECPGLRGAVRLRGKVSSSCNGIHGSAWARHGEPSSLRLTATVGFCGDGNVLPELGEECDVGTACAAGSQCTLGCRCIPASPTTTTTLPPPPPLCGNGRFDAGEECDTAAYISTTCYYWGFNGGEMACAPDCTLDTSGCAVCGDGVREGDEACDGADLNGHTCADVGYSGDGLACDDDCAGFDTDGCERCHNGIVEADEECDGVYSDVLCTDLGHSGGPGEMARCSLCRIDTSNCSVCGNGEQEPGEECDDGNDELRDGCTPSCEHECGNGTVEPNELCDDGNEIGGDGCSGGCFPESFYGGGGDEGWESAAGWGMSGPPEVAAQNTCQDGAACDQDMEADRCTFRVFPCFLLPPLDVLDPLATVRLTEPSLSGPTALEPANVDAFLAAITDMVSRAGRAVTRDDTTLSFTPALELYGPCGVFPLAVPVCETRSLSVRLESAGATFVDNDQLDFTCTGSEPCPEP